MKVIKDERESKCSMKLAGEDDQTGRISQKV
jgi:hypothetical protein